jgi:PhnB protein
MDGAKTQRECQPVTVMAQLSVRRGRAAVEFYRAAFGAIEDYRVGGNDENEAVVSQLSVGSGTFWVADESPENANFSPESVGGSTTRMLLVADDPDEAIARAVAAGARLVRPATDEHGWRLGRIEDPFGHHWEIARPRRTWPPRPGTGV